MRKDALYKKIINHIEQMILTGSLKSGDLVPSEFELAEEFGVSRITAKKAMDLLAQRNLIYRIKGKGSFVCEKTEILKSAKPAESSMSNVVALILPYPSSLDKSIDLVHAISNVLKESGYYLTVHISNRDTEEERKIIKDLVKNGVRGIILCPVSHRKNTDIFNWLYINNYPIVIVANFIDMLPISCVLSDNLNGGYMAASHLLELGHKEIVYITDLALDYSTSVANRYFGFCKALKENSVDLKDDNLICVDQLSDNAVAALKNYDSSKSYLLDPLKRVLDSLINRPNRCTAAFAMGDHLAIYLIKAALEMNISIPNDFSIIGFGNAENGTYLEVSLSTIEMNFYKVGEEAGKLIIEKINNYTNENKRIIVPVDLIKRSSTGVVQY